MAESWCLKSDYRQGSGRTHIPQRSSAGVIPVHCGVASVGPAIDTVRGGAVRPVPPGRYTGALAATVPGCGSHNTQTMVSTLTTYVTAVHKIHRLLRRALWHRLWPKYTQYTNYSERFDRLSVTAIHTIHRQWWALWHRLWPQYSQYTDYCEHSDRLSVKTDCESHNTQNK